MEGGYALRKRNKHVGSSLDEFLKEEGILAETRAVALKDAIAWQVQQTMQKEKITKVEMARRMRTSRAALDRLLAPGNASVMLWVVISASNWCNRLSGYYPELHLIIRSVARLSGQTETGTLRRLGC
jgi:antitoxin HicB